VGRPSPTSHRRPHALAALLLLGVSLGCVVARPLAQASPATALHALPPASPWFRIRVLDAATGRGVPAVELRTTDARVFYTDSAGVVAFGEPDLFGQSVLLGVRSFGYHFPQRVLGEPAALVEPRAGGEVTLRVARDNVAERLYRLTGSGIYRDSALLGDPVPELAPDSEPSEPLPTGMDSAQAELYRGRLFWTWGDTKLASTPLGNFRTSGATSLLPGQGGLDPEVGVRFEYFLEDGRLRPMVADVHPVIWLSALRTAREADGTERLFATYRKIVAPLTTVELGLAELDDAAGVFRLVASYGRDEPRAPDGHAFHHGEHIYYDLAVRSPADAAGVRELARYESFTALAPGARLDGRAPALERDSAGELVWAWKAGTPPLGREAWEALERAGAVRPDEAWYRLVDVETGAPVSAHGGSVTWNAHRRRWIRIATQIGGRPSFLGEVWYFEADAPDGPWAYGRRILTHGMAAPHRGSEPAELDTYTFYNPTQHPEFARNGGREIYFEGTFTSSFTHRPWTMPGYDYNQILYKLDLDDPRLAVPVAIYRVQADGRLRSAPDIAPGAARRLAFFAPDRPGPGRVAVRDAEGTPGRLRASADATPDAHFYCASPEGAPPPGTTPLYELRNGETWTYTSELAPEARAAAALLCHVWPRLVRYDPSAQPPRP
jgi:hypothetical protein